MFSLICLSKFIPKEGATTISDFMKPAIPASFNPPPPEEPIIYDFLNKEEELESIIGIVNFEQKQS